MIFPDSLRYNRPGYESSPGDTFGVFLIRDGADLLYCIATDGDCITTYGDDIRWEHVSITVKNRRGVQLGRCPTWEQMAKVKATFWSDDEAVMQLHPPRSDYVNHHPYCLHLWRPVGVDIPRPLSIFVGPSSSPPTGMTKPPPAESGSNTAPWSR